MGCSLWVMNLSTLLLQLIDMLLKSRNLPRSRTLPSSSSLNITTMRPRTYLPGNICPLDDESLERYVPNRCAQDCKEAVDNHNNNSQKISLPNPTHGTASSMPDLRPLQSRPNSHHNISPPGTDRTGTHHQGDVWSQKNVWGRNITSPSQQQNTALYIMWTTYGMLTMYVVLYIKSEISS